MVRSEQWDKNWGSKKSFLEVAVAAPARVIVVSSSPLRRVALRDAMRALSCVPHAIAATFEDTAADLAQERHGADDATMARRWNPVDSWPFCLARGFVVSVVFFSITYSCRRQDALRRDFLR